MPDTIITDGQGHYKISKNGQWVDYTGPIPGQKPDAGGGKKLNPSDSAFLNRLSEGAASAREVGRLYDRAEGALKAIRPGPYRNRLLLSPSIPEDNGGILDAIGSVVIGGPAKLTGAVTPEEVSNYQTVRGLQSGGVLEKQLAQKGPQTESDAARMMLTEISPGKDMAANNEIIRAGRQKIDREQAKAAWYTFFTNKYGLHGTTPEGYTADQLWARAQDHIVNRMIHGGGPYKPPQNQQNTGIRIISRTKVK